MNSENFEIPKIGTHPVIRAAIGYFEKNSEAINERLKRDIRLEACSMATAVLPIFSFSYKNIAPANAIKASRSYALGLTYYQIFMEQWGNPVLLHPYTEFDLDDTQRAAMHAHMAAIATTTPSSVEALFGAAEESANCIRVFACEHGADHVLVSRASQKLYEAIVNVQNLFENECKNLTEAG